MIEGYRLCNDPGEMDLTTIHGFIAGSYWAKGIPLETFERAIQNSLCFGIFTERSPARQVAFARLISDYATYAYLADVFVAEEHRGKGLSKWLMQTISDCSELKGLRRITLATKDAHGLYEKFGFKSLAHPEIFMERWDPEIYS